MLPWVQFSIWSTAVWIIQRHRVIGYFIVNACGFSRVCTVQCRTVPYSSTAIDLLVGISCPPSSGRECMMTRVRSYGCTRVVLSFGNTMIFVKNLTRDHEQHTLNTGIHTSTKFSRILIHKCTAVLHPLPVLVEIHLPR